MQRPLIGITTAKYANQYGWRYHQGYAANADAIARAGGLPVYLPLEMPAEVIYGTYERLDGVLLPGGGDVEPGRYNETERARLVEVDPDRDEIEIKLAQWAVRDNLPTLGICRGHQVLNVALGGKLVQDVPTLIETDIKHDIPFDQPRKNAAHDVQVTAGSKLAAVLGSTEVAVNSLHHQAVTEVGEGVRITAHAADGLVEGIELPDLAFVLSVQWHPEDMVGHNEAADRLFEAFVAAARERMTTPKSRTTA